MLEVAYGEDYFVTMPLINAGAQNYESGVTLAAGDVTFRTNSQSHTNVLARTIEFTSGSEEPKNGDVIVGATSGDRASYMGAMLSGGTWAGGDAAGEIFLKALDSAAIPAFQSENLNIEGGTSNFATIGAALKAAGIIAEIGTSKEYAIGLTGTELQTDRGMLFIVDATATEEWEDDGREIRTVGHPLADDDRGVRWAGHVGLNNLLTFAGLAVDTQTIVIGGKTYTTQDTLTDVDGNVDIPGTAEEAAVNMACAIELCEAIAFTSMSELPAVGNTLSGDTSGFTCIVTGVFITSGTIAGGDAAGWLLVNTLSGAFQAENLTNDTTTTANVVTIGADFTGPGSRYAASMTAHTLVRGQPTNGAKLLIYTKDGIVPQRIPCTETQTNASWAFTTMQANIVADGTTVDLPDANNWDSPTNDDDANDHYIEITDESGNVVSGYINTTDVAGGTFYGGADAEAGGFDIGAVRLTIKTGSLFRLDLTGSWKLKYAIVPEREVPVRLQSKLSTVGLSTQEKTDVNAEADTALQDDVVGFKMNQLVEDFMFPMRDADGDLVTGETVTVEISKDGGAFAGVTSVVGEIGATGIYSLTTSPSLLAAEMNCDQGFIKCTSSGAKPTLIQFYTET